ncbi:L-2,4-diaminobutyrate decarboxylase [Pontibacter aydingkolensis]|uniref:Aminotransferase class I/II-fold pyridoxal phosphate-dependent enzyme n=1 Tax=Pontibacter aydingkolensis TaxID=1911536 RepID=A0ABS7CVQ8_9BACT|nr:aminotransferase class I/II-fold pyridoxal phosphate-dependent enzyme [Pontibacter aydingkolensis]MBW7467791.1 aminotransferase class I/II-fold pyridoxal phosphate-dependent enzyme [Pontibacter aydingkolensis]
MENILDKAYATEDFRRQGHALIDLMADYLAQATSDSKEVQAIPWQSPEKQLDYWQKDFSKVDTIDPLDLFRDVIDRSIQVHRKRYLGHQTTPTLPVTVLSAAVTALLNQGMGVYEMGMVGNTFEKLLTEHLAQKLGFSGEASGFITSGGSLGNLTALLAARAACTGIWHNGYVNEQKLAVLVSEEAHYCIDRSARIMGFGAAGIIKVPVNDKFQMRTELLESYYQQAITDGKQVISVIGCAGSTSTGSYDDLEAIAAFSQKYNIWFHVDGAHGAPAAFSPKYQHLVKGIEKANSVVVDYHKMMMTPSLSTAVLFKNGSDAYRSFSQRAQYLWTDQDTEEWYNGGKRTFECTKAMSALNVYTIFRTYGDDVFRENIERLYGLAEKFAELIKSKKNFELAYEPQCNIVCFRLRTASDVSKLNLAIRNQLLEDGRFYIVQTVLNGDLYLRVSLMNPLSTEEELIELLQAVEEKAVILTSKV